MAKQLNSNQNGHNGHDSGRYTTPEILTTSKGEKVKIVGLNQIRFEEVSKAGKEPEVPYRLMETAIGEPQKEELTADTLFTDEERSQWADYIAKKEALDAKRSKNILRYVYDEGIIVDESKMDQWKQEEEEVYEIELPKNRIDLKVAYINAKIIGNPDDLADIMASVMERTGFPAARLEELRDTFRGTVRQDTPTEVEDPEGQVAVE